MNRFQIAALAFSDNPSNLESVALNKLYVEQELMPSNAPRVL